MNFSRISAEKAKTLLAKADTNLIDIRDEQSFRLGHIVAAQHIDNHCIAEFIAKADKSKPLIVCCYHGNSSQSAAQFFVEQSFQEVYSLDGGFEHWRTLYPQDCTQGQ